MQFGGRGPLLVGLIGFSERGSGMVQELALPLGDLVGVHVEALSDHDQRLFTLDGFQSHLALKAGEWLRLGLLSIVGTPPWGSAWSSMVLVT
jgi:hypothetical protein